MASFLIRLSGFHTYNFPRNSLYLKTLWSELRHRDIREDIVHFLKPWLTTVFVLERKQEMQNCRNKQAHSLSLLMLQCYSDSGKQA
jgi:hypothetical protein